MDGAPVSDTVREAIREKVRELSNLSRELEQLTKQMSAAQSTLQVGFLKDRVDQLTTVQNRLVKEITHDCPDSPVRSRFEELDRRLQAVRGEVQEAKKADELKRLREEIEPLVDEWAQVFQELVVGVLGSPKATAGDGTTATV